MDVFVFDKNYNVIGIIESPISLSYIERFKEKGEFTLSIPLSSFNLGMMKKDNFLLFDSERGIAGVVEKWKKSSDLNKSSTIVVTGGLCDAYVYRRIIWGQYVKSGTVPDIVEDLMMKHLVSPSDEKRAISDVEVERFTGEKGPSIKYQQTGAVLGEALEEICSTGNFGFSMKFDYVNKKMIFSVLKGKDRTIKQSKYPACVFSQKYDNILSSEYEENHSSYKNVALVAAEGESEKRVYVTVFPDGESEASGKDRIEYFVDARDLQSSDGGQQIPEQDYKLMLEQRGKEKLDTLKPVVNFDCVLSMHGSIKYARDFFLGDIVTVQDESTGVEADAEISEVESVFDAKGEELRITFGYNQLSLLKAIKAKVVS